MILRRLNLTDCLRIDFDSNHADVSTTMIKTHVLNRGGKGVLSPLDRLV
jgi:hypothetical protein